MTKIKLKYKERAQKLAQAIDIAEKIIIESKVMDKNVQIAMLEFGKTTKNDALNPEPKYHKIASLKYLENDFFYILE